MSKPKPPPHGSRSRDEDEEYWDYAEDAESGEADDPDASGDAAEPSDEGEELAEEDDEPLAEEDVEPLEEEDDEAAADETGEGIAADVSASKSRAPWIWMAAAAAWAAVMLVKFGDDAEPVPAGPSLHVEQGLGDDDAPSPPPERAPIVEDPELEPAPEAEPEPEAPSKIALRRDGQGRWWNPQWDADLELPARVTYTVKRGGSIKFIANLYKIYHHEIQTWNPGVPLDKELGPGTKVTVFERTPESPSESLGLATRGSLVGGVPMVDGAGRILKHTPWKGWATAATVAVLDRALIAWSERGSESKPVQPVLVGNMSSREGGRLKPHGSHQSGRDVDLSYIQKGPDTAELNWREMHAQNLDAGETWRLLETLVATGAVENIFIDTAIQELLYDYALEQQLVSKRDLKVWLEYPRPVGSANSIVKHVRGHVDHIHVRFACPASQRRCQSK